MRIKEKDKMSPIFEVMFSYSYSKRIKKDVSSKSISKGGGEEKV